MPGNIVTPTLERLHRSIARGRPFDANSPTHVTDLKLAWHLDESKIPPCEGLFQNRLSEVQARLSNVGNCSLTASLPPEKATPRAEELAAIKNKFSLTAILKLSAPAGTTYSGKAVWDTNATTGSNHAPLPPPTRLVRQHGLPIPHRPPCRVIRPVWCLNPNPAPSSSPVAFIRDLPVGAENGTCFKSLPAPRFSSVRHAADVRGLFRTFKA